MTTTFASAARSRTALRISSAVFTGTQSHAVGNSQIGRPADQDHFGAATHCGFSYRVAHFARKSDL